MFSAVLWIPKRAVFSFLLLCNFCMKKESNNSQDVLKALETGLRSAEQQLADDVIRSTARTEMYGSTASFIDKYCKTLGKLDESKLPSLLLACMKVYLDNRHMYDERARDILFLSSLVVLGILFPTVRLPYGTKRHSITPSLVTNGGSGSNKSLMLFAAMLLNAVNNFINPSLILY